jgi:hypothetical protein
MSMKTKIMTPIIGVGILLGTPTDSNASEEIVGKAADYEIVIQTDPDDQSSIAQLKKDGEILRTSEDIFDLVTVAPTNVKKSLLNQIVNSEITKEGGVERYQRLVDENLRKYGNDFFNYMSGEIKRAYEEQGVRLTLPTNEMTNQPNTKKESRVSSREPEDEIKGQSDIGNTSTSMEWE